MPSVPEGPTTPTLLAVVRTAEAGPRRPDGLPTAEDRATGAAWLASSHARLREAFRTLPAPAWRSAPAGRWSAAEVAEHLVRTERSVLAFVRGPLLASPAACAAGIAPDGHLAERMADRARRQPCPEGLQPTGRWTSPGPLLDALDEARAEVLAYVRDGHDPLRAHAAPHPTLGLLDGWQWLLFLAAHTDRHAAQVRALATRLPVRAA